jgi:RNA polymerase sigma factor (sigma-70 family)
VPPPATNARVRGAQARGGALRGLNESTLDFRCGSFGGVIPSDREAIERSAVETLVRARARAGVPGLTPAERRRRELEVRHARDALVLGVLGLIFTVARRAARTARSLEEGDLVAVGVLAALSAVDQHDPSLGSFVAFAASVIRRRVARAVLDLDGVVRVPSSARIESRRIGRLRQRFVQARGRSPSSAELAALSGLSIGQVERRLALADVRTVSVNVPIGEGDDEWLDVFPSGDPGPELVVGQVEREAIVRRLVQALPSREARVVFARAMGATLEEIGERVGRTRERIRQVEQGGMAILRVQAAAAGLDPQATGMSCRVGTMT